MRLALILICISACSAATAPCQVVKQPAVYVNQYNNGVLIKADTLFVGRNTCTGELSRWEE